MRDLRTALFGVLGAFAFALAVVSAPAHADDSGPGRDWSGVYGGVHGGGVFVDGDYDVDTGGGGVGPFVDNDIDLEGFVGGVLLGWNWQSGNFVYGIEIDGWYGDVDDTAFLGGGFGLGEFTVVSGASGRLRLGWAMDNTLFFLTGGAAGAMAEVRFVPAGGMDEDTHFGLLVGGGIEHRFDGIGVRAEYIYGHYFEKEYEFGPFEDEFEWEQHVIRAAVVLYLGDVFGTR